MVAHFNSSIQSSDHSAQEYEYIMCFYVRYNGTFCTHVQADTYNFISFFSSTKYNCTHRAPYREYAIHRHTAVAFVDGGSAALRRPSGGYARLGECYSHLVIFLEHTLHCSNEREQIGYRIAISPLYSKYCLLNQNQLLAMPF